MKKTAIVCVILILIGLAGTLAFLSLGRAGGEIGFDATVTQVEEDVIYATVTNDNDRFISLFAAYLPDIEPEFCFIHGSVIA